MTHYEKLGVSKTASQAEIKEAYKNLIKKYHPDVYQGNKTYAEKMTKEINVAYDVLSNPEKKLEYDNEINPPQTYKSSGFNYSYTPPKYDRPPTDYTSYRKADNSRSYNYNDRYTDFHRNKSPNSNYYETSHIEEKILNIFDTNKIVFIFLIFIIYAVLLIFTLCQFYALKNNNFSGSIFDSQEKNKLEENIVIPSNDYTNTTTISPFPDNYNNFNINDYVSDEELYQLYKEYFYDDYKSFSDFKNEFSKELYDYYSEFY